MVRARGGLGVVLEVAGVLGVCVVTPLLRPGSLVVPDGERGDPCSRHCLIMFSQDACLEG